MPQAKFQLYKHIKISGKWCHRRAAIYSNGKVRPRVVFVEGQKEEHEEGSYFIRHKKVWHRSRHRPAGSAADAQQAR